ncbi:MAG: YceI family protein [Wenzhouxiangella sp.]
MNTTVCRAMIVSLSLFVLFLLAGCQAQPRAPATAGETRPAGEEPAEMPVGRVFHVLPEQSDLRIVVFAAGPLARFGHPHVIGGPVIHGQVVLTEPFHDSALQLRINVDELEVDRPEWRLDEGFDPDMERSAIDGTRRNMLAAGLLDVDQYPEIMIESVGLNGPDWQPDIDLRITLAGNTRELTVPVALEIASDSLSATGRMTLRQSEFGIEPFSAAGGNLQVADLILVRFRVVAKFAAD